MKHIRNGGLEAGIIEARGPETKYDNFILSLPKNRTEWIRNEYTYFINNDNSKIFRFKIGTLVLEELENNTPIIKMSMRNASGGWIHVDVAGQQHWDLYCTHKLDFIFLNGCPY